MGLEMAELAARLERSENEVLRLASAGPSALGPAVDAMNRAGAEAGVGVWRLRLGRTAEGLTALRDAESRFLSWLDLLVTDDRARETYFRSGGWLGLYRRSVVFGWPDVEARLGAIGTDPGDGGMVGVARPWVRTALAMAREDGQELSAAVSELKAVPDEQATRDKWFLGVGAAVEALLGGDQASLGPLLGALFRRHGELLKRGSLSDAGLETQEPEVLLALARRQGLEPVVDETDRSIQLRQKVLHVTEWEGEPVGPTEFHVEVDLTDAEVAWRVVEKAPPAPRGRKSKVASEVSEEVVRSALATQAQGVGPVWNRASAAFALGDVALARQLLVTEMAAARDRTEQERLASGRRNVNHILEHLSLAVAVGRPSDVGDAAASLRRLVVESPGTFGPSRYSMAQGYLVLIADVLDGLSPGRNDALGLFAHLRRAAVGLLDRDEKALTAGLDDVLREHVKRIDRKYPGAAPLCVEGLHLASAASRLGIPPTIDPSFRSFPVPILITNVAGHEGKVGRVPLDLIGEALWAGDATAP